MKQREKKNERKKQHNYSTSSKADLWKGVQSHVQDKFNSKEAKKAVIHHFSFPSIAQIQ